MFEHYRQPLLPKQAFYLRLVRSLAVSAALLIATIFLGAIIFRWIEHFNWLDAALNSVLIMTGVGTTGIINTPAGKIFTAIYSIFSTLIFFTILAIIFTPILHRLLHKFHLDIDKKA
ncbi:MAG: two pore domain potassium channel family protein [Candidatus Omnitrophica bacterium]|nr:two pore domain potassium channel family protein [Candidatus Omnitrophota bacterium]